MSSAAAPSTEPIQTRRLRPSRPVFGCQQPVCVAGKLADREGVPLVRRDEERHGGATELGHGAREQTFSGTRELDGHEPAVRVAAILVASREGVLSASVPPHQPGPAYLGPRGPDVVAIGDPGRAPDRFAAMTVTRHAAYTTVGDPAREDVRPIVSAGAPAVARVRKRVPARRKRNPPYVAGADQHALLSGPHVEDPQRLPVRVSEAISLRRPDKPTWPGDLFRAGASDARSVKHRRLVGLRAPEV